jgi:hypothetical protein
MKTYVMIMVAISALFAALLASAIHETQGTGRTALYCSIGVVAIWIIGYIKGRLFGWIQPDRKDPGAQE